MNAERRPLPMPSVQTSSHPPTGHLPDDERNCRSARSSAVASRPALRNRIAAARSRSGHCAATGLTSRRSRRRQVQPVRMVGRGRAGWRRARQSGTLILLRGGSGAAGPTTRYGLRFRLDVLLPILLFLFSFGQNMADVNSTVFHPDESRWLNRAHFLTDLRDPFGPTWQDQYLARAQPPLGSYLMGLGLLMQGRDTETTAVWDFTYGVEWNELAGAMPTQADLDAGRRTNAVVGALVVVVVYFIGRALTNRAGATFGALFLALHPLHIWLASQALSDQLLNLLLALATLACIRFAQQPTWGRMLVLGTLLGLGGAAKLSPMLLSLPLAGFGVFLLVRSLRVFRPRAPRLDRAMGVRLLAMPAIAFAVFVASYPYLWTRPIHHTLNLFELRTREMGGQARAWPDVAVDSRTDAFGRIGERLTEQFSTTGRLLSWAARSVGITWLPSGIDFILVAAGAVLFVGLVVRSGLRSPAGLAGLLLASQAGAIIIGLRADFYRYHLPIALIMSICVALTFGALSMVLARFDAWRWLAVLPGISVSPSRARQPNGAFPSRAESKRNARVGAPGPTVTPPVDAPAGPAPRPASQIGTVLHGK